MGGNRARLQQTQRSPCCLQTASITIAYHCACKTLRGANVLAGTEAMCAYKLRAESRHVLLAAVNVY